jgi:Ca2+-binding RTX toxin-like protein
LPAGQDADDVRYLVQAVNGVGLVGIDDNQGTYFIPGVIPGLEDDLAPTSLVLADGNPDAGNYGESVTVRATLTNEAGAGLANRAVTFALGGSSRTAFTNSAGVAVTELPMTVLPGEYDLVASYDGDSETAPAADAAGGFTVSKQPTTLTLAVAAGTASATLLDSNDLPVREKIVYFAYVDAAGAMLAGRTVITNYRGVAELPLTERPEGATQIRAYFGVAETPVPGGETIDLSDPSYAAAGPVTAGLPSTAPVAKPDSYSVVEGQTLAIAAPGVLGNDTGAQTALLVSGPTQGTLDLRSDGSFTYSPPAGFVGTVTFTYAAVAGAQQSDPATVTIMVTEATPGECTIRGTDGNDTLTGTSGNDVICGFGGNDTINGGNGNDLILAGPGDDTATGGNGNDVIIAGPGKDTAKGGNGKDRLDLRDGAPGDLGDGGNGKDVAESDSGDTLISVP